MMRADLAALKALGFSEEELVDLGLHHPAVGDPECLVDAYIRRSKKREDLTTLRAHLRDIVRWCRAEGLAVRHVWFEQRSASKIHVRRDEFEKAKEAVLAGQSRTLAVWKTDRLDRRGMGAVGALLDELDRRRSRLISVSEGLDSSKGGRLVFAFLSERARDEAKDIAERVQIGLDSHRVLGRAPGGRPPFGVQSLGNGKVGPHPAEYPTARCIADALLNGEASTTLAHRLTEQGLRTRTGRHWSANAISRMAQSPLWAGLVPHRERKTDEFGNPIDKWGWKAEPLIGPDGHPISCGTGVVSLTEWYAIRSRFASRTVRGLRGGHGVKTPAKLLTGILHCPRCAVGMVSGGASYRCRTRMEGGPAACPGVRTKVDRADEAVAGAWVRRISSMEPGDPVLHEIARRWLRYQDPEQDERALRVSAALEDAERRGADLDDAYYVHGRMKADRYERLSDGLREQTRAMRAELTELHRQSDLTPLLDGQLLGEAWEDAPLADQRMLLRCALKKVTLLPASGQGDRTPMLDRINFDWVEAQDDR
ncbi:recombinase family protein [Streptomyces sp. NPDC091371]|uniref:recombinase family protein n=1 Tax=Streptomyces sp. NPDC091371 TaxID=3155303 RepID=UPI0034285A3C